MKLILSNALSFLLSAAAAWWLLPTDWGGLTSAPSSEESAWSVLDSGHANIASPNKAPSLQSVRDLADQVMGTDWEELASQWQSMDRSLENHRVNQILLERLLELDSDATWHLLANGSLARRDAVIYKGIALEAWLFSSPSQAIAGTQDDPLFGSLIMQAARRASPEAVSSWVPLLEVAGLTKEVSRVQFQRLLKLAESDPPQAVSEALADEINPSSLYSEWAEHDPSAALEWIQQLPASQHEKALTVISQQWISQSPAEALRALWGQLDDSRRRDLIYQLRNSRVDTYEITDLKAWKEGLPENSRWRRMLDESLFYLAAKRAPEQLPGMMSEIDFDNRKQVIAIAEAAEEWILSDADEAIRWIASLRDTSIREKTLTSAFDRLTKHSKDQAFALLDQYGDQYPHLAEVLNEKILTTLPSRGASMGDVSEWLEKVPPSHRAASLQKYVQSPQAEMEVVAELLIHVQPGVARRTAIQHLMGRLASEDSVYSAEWALEHTVGESRLLALRNVAAVWSAYDPKHAAHWFETQLRGEQGLGRVWEAIATPLAFTDLPHALRLLRRIDDPSEREKAIVQAIHAQAIRDPQQALRELQGQALAALTKHRTAKQIRERDALTSYLLEGPSGR